MDEQRKTLGRSRIYTGETMSGDFSREAAEDAAEAPVINTRRTAEGNGAANKVRRTSDRKSEGSDTADVSSGGASAPEGRRSRRAQTIGVPSRERLTEPSGRRRRDEETDFRMRILWIILSILIVILVIAIFYEIVLGYGQRETGSQRMGTGTQEAGTLLESESDEPESEESESESESADGSSDDSSDDSSREQGSQTAQNEEDEQETVTREVSGESEGTSASGGVTLAGAGD
ncbi:MAG: hypothetical protein LUF35_02260 [Lachnospiraceae bacterium]|nr:hypothetical protein [Lachnospiraceae bacterium]